jgi:hypothetical protein
MTNIVYTYMIENLKKISILAIIVLMFVFNINYTTWTDGDEPHYISGTESLVNNRDIDLKNEQINKTFLDFRPIDDFVIHYWPDKNDKFRPHHGIGASILYMPAYAIAKHVIKNNGLIVKSIRFTQFVIFLIGVLMMIALLKLVILKSAFDYLALVPWLISPTVFLYSTVIFPDMIQGVFFGLTAIGLIKLYNKSRSEYKSQRFDNFLIYLGGVGAGFNVFVHYKTLLTTGLFFVFYCLYAILTKNKKMVFNKNIIVFLLPFVVSIVLHMMMTYNWYNTINFSSIQGITSTSNVGSVFQRWFPNNPLIGISGQFLDIDKGMFWMAPTVIFYLLGLSRWFKEDRFSFTVIAIPSIISIFAYSTFVEWAAGFCPAGRYVVPFMFVMFPSYYFTYNYIKRFVIGKAYIVLSIIMSVLILLSFKYRMGIVHRNGFPSLLSTNLHYSIISKFFRIPDVNNYLRIFDFEFKPVLSWYGFCGAVIISIVLIQFVKILFQINNNKTT